MSSLIIGEALIDEVTGRDGSVRSIPGGAMLNVAIGLRRLGRTVRLITDIGGDENGDVLAEYAASNGLELWLRDENERTNPTCVAHAVVDHDGSVNYDLEYAWDIIDVPTSGAGKLDLEVLNPRTVAFGSFSCHVEPGASKVRRWVEHLRETSTIFYDPNVRASQFTDMAVGQAEVESFAALADIVKVSRADLRALYGPHADADKISAHLLELGPALVVLTEGADGATMYSSSGYVMGVAAPTIEVVDTIGAGAAFLSALIDGLSRISLGGAEYRANLRDMSPTNLQTLGAYAATAAAIAVSRSGANPPSREELIDRFEYYQTSTITGLRRVHHPVHV